ncbi:MAG: Papain family cysteine protease [Frankiales bacterium]|nr:Papain family cysteine protease [Frankiales bacterium]
MRFARRPALALAVAVLAGLLVTPASTAAVPLLDPSAALSGATRTVQVTASAPVLAGQLTITRSDDPAEVYSAPLLPTGVPARYDAELPLGDTVSRGPANPGIYDVAVTSAGTPVDTCSRCFTVTTPGAPGVVSAASVAPSQVAPSTPTEVVFTGSSFTRGTAVEVLYSGSIDPLVRVDAASSTATTGQLTAGSSTSIARTLTVTSGAPVGKRSIRFRNSDGRSTVCGSCLSVLGPPLSSVEPTGATNDRVLDLTLRGTGLPSGATARLIWTGPRPAGVDLDIIGRTKTVSATAIVATFDLNGAAPGSNGYTVGYSSPDGVITGCVGICRFTVQQILIPVISVIAPRTLKPGTSQRVSVSGSGLNAGTTMDLGPDTAVTAVTSSTAGSLSATVAVAAGAVGGIRDVVVKNTDGQSSTCVGCLALTGPPAPSPSPVASPTKSAAPSPSASPSASPSPSPSASPSASPSPSPPAPSPEPPAEPDPEPVAPTIRLAPAQSLAGQKVQVTGTAEPGATVELLAYTRPGTTYAVVRTAEVAEDGTYAFTVAPAANTRVFARVADSQAQSPSAVLKVATSINVKVTRTGVRTYRFTGSTLPKRPGQTINVYYVAGSKKIIAGKAVVTPKGTYLFERRFGAGGTLAFTAQTGVDLSNVAGTSAPVRVALR